MNDAAELPEELRELLAEGGNVVDATETLKQQRELKKAAKASIPKQKKARALEVDHSYITLNIGTVS